MTFNIISTINGEHNEGMRNIASHMAEELGSMCDVRLSPLGNPAKCLKNSFGADAVIIFARASANVAYLALILRYICSRVYFVLVQQPEKDFLNILGCRADKYVFFAVCPGDAAKLEMAGGKVHRMYVGIDSKKFRPAESREEISALRRKYGFSDDLPLVIHVGHLSAGRGLEEFLSLSGERFQRLVVASGMFECRNIEERLHSDGVRIIKEYLPDISEVYRMADVYLFPTKTSEFVISVPLSVMEALACGTPVVAFKGVEGLFLIKSSVPSAFICIDDSSELEKAVLSAAQNSGGEFCFLEDALSWYDAARKFMRDIESDIQQET